MSAAGQAAKRDMSHILLEKTDHLSDTIYKYQAGKFVMATPSNLALRAGGYEDGASAGMQFDEGTRENILGIWNQHCGIEDPTIPLVEGEIENWPVNVKLNAEVTKVEGDKGDFSITLKSGETLKAKTIILAIGTQGNPNKLRCPGADHPMITSQLDDPADHYDKNIVVVGTGDAGIENALGLAEEALGNTVSILNRGKDFAKAKQRNADWLTEADRDGKLKIRYSTSPAEVRDGEMKLETETGEETIPCDLIIARIGSQPPRKFIEEMGVEFTSEDRSAFPVLSPVFETTKSGIFVIGALAGYPLIKHCMNQGFDVIEYLSTGESPKPADEPLLEEVFADLPGNKSVDHWLEVYQKNVTLFNGLSILQMRELMLDSTCRAFRPGEVIFRRNEQGSSLFAIAQGSVAVEVDPNDPSITVPIGQGSIFGEVGLISGRRRGSTIRAAEDTVVVELSRKAALKLITSSPEANDAVTRISIERQILQMFGSGLTPADIAPLVESAVTEQVPAGKVVIQEGDDDRDLFILRLGSMLVEKDIGGRPIFLSYLPAGSFFGEMAVIDRDSKRTATVKASVKSEVIRLPGEGFLKLLDDNPQLRKRMEEVMRERRQTNDFIESQKGNVGNALELYTETAKFLSEQGIGEATDALLIDEKLCIGCDNCERACADAHEGLSRLDREAGKSYAHLHVPTSCRHCEHPHCMADCPPNAIRRGADGEVSINAETCIGCGNCKSNCPYGVIRMDPVPPKKPSLLSWLFFGKGPGPGEASYKWRKEHGDPDLAKKAIKCDMCAGISGGPACVRACPTGAAIRVSPDKFLTFAKLTEDVES
ncbi:MAG: cyclic nucleotide-binding domain-containing protein [Erythrobacter sp.]